MTVPLYSAEHYYIVTEAIDGLDRTTPTLRDPDGYTYFKEEVRGLLMGGFEPDAKPWVASDEIPEPFEFQLLPEDWNQFDILHAQRRAPGAGDGEHRRQEVLQRPGELHAGPQLHHGPGAGAG